MKGGPSKDLGRYALLAPLLVSTVLAVLASLGLILALSFQTVDVTRLFTTPTLDAYAENLGEPLFWRLLLRSILIALAVMAVTIVLAYPVAYVISFRVRKYKSALLLVVSAPFFTSYLLRIFAWKIILGYNGILNGLLLNLGLIHQPLGIWSTGRARWWSLDPCYLAFAILPIYVGLNASTAPSSKPPPISVPARCETSCASPCRSPCPG